MSERKDEEQTPEEMVAQIEAIFDLRWAADMRAIKRWQASTGRTLTWPDHTDLLGGLLSELDKAEAANDLRLTQIMECEKKLDAMKSLALGNADDASYWKARFETVEVSCEDAA